MGVRVVGVGRTWTDAGSPPSPCGVVLALLVLVRELGRDLQPGHQAGDLPRPVPELPPPTSPPGRRPRSSGSRASTSAWRRSRPSWPPSSWSGLDADASARVLRLALLTAAAFGAATSGPCSCWVRRSGAGHVLGRRGRVYVANPYVVVAGGTLAVLWPYALLPWLVSDLVASRRPTAGLALAGGCRACLRRDDRHERRCRTADPARRSTGVPGARPAPGRVLLAARRRRRRGPLGTARVPSSPPTGWCPSLGALGAGADRRGQLRDRSPGSPSSPPGPRSCAASGSGRCTAATAGGPVAAGAGRPT